MCKAVMHELMHFIEGSCAAEKAGEQADPTVSLDTAGRKRGEMAYGAEGEQGMRISCEQLEMLMRFLLFLINT